jgi:small subunit ribosomal protein S4
VGKVSRRLGFGISEKGERILKRRPNTPGMHGPNVRANKKQSDYAIRLAEKQKAKYIYGLLEKQFRRTFEAAKKETGETGVALFSLLERRLDNVVFRLGYGRSRAHARQLVNHGHFLVNGRKTDIPSFTVKIGDVVTVRAESRKTPFFRTLGEGSDLLRRGPAWLNAEGAQMSARVVSMPQREDAEQGINEQLIVEYYSR